MYLKSIILLGFKSFCDKTTLEFQRGITAIVGPNGSGKSNICDAIRWVLGEQSAKALRGETMADVIFNGTEERKPLSMAEVSLVLGDVDKAQLKAAGLPLDFNELTITRRVYRDGIGEYLINGIQCRLKDIQQLFMGTGIGRTSYSILAQGQITQLLSTRPEDRRMVFEEAAGISKYKAQRKEALRKLEYTEQNLVRLADLIREVKRQIGSLQRQAAKARRYKEFTKQLEFLETQFARHQYDCLLHELHCVQQKVAELQAQLTKVEAEGLTIENEVSMAREELRRIQEELTSAQEVKSRVNAQIQQHRDRINFNLQRLSDVQAREKQARGEITLAEERIANVRVELHELVRQRDLLLEEIKEKERSFAARQAYLTEVEAKIRSYQQQVAELQTKLFENAQLLAQLRNKISNAEHQVRIDGVRLQKLQEEGDRLLAQRQELEARLSDRMASMETHEAELSSAREQAAKIRAEIRELEGQLRDVIDRINNISRQFAEANSRLDVLKQLEASYEGFAKGTVAALKVREFAEGVLADKIQVPNQYVCAIESALGHHLELVLAEHAEGARAILDQLRNNNLGRAHIAVLQLCREIAGFQRQETVSTDAVCSRDGYIPALSVVSSEEMVRPLVETLLGKTLIVENLEKALAGLKNGLAGHDFVTLSGEVLTRHGVLIGGSLDGEGHNPVSILARKNEIVALEREIQELRVIRGSLEQERDTIRAKLDELQSSLEGIEKHLRQCELKGATSRAELNTLKSDLNAVTQRLTAIDFEIENLRAEIEELTEERKHAVDELTALETQGESLRSAFDEARFNLERLQQERESVLNSVSEARVQLATSKQQLDGLEKQIRALTQRLKELEETTRIRLDEIEAGRVLIDRAQAEIRESERSVEDLQRQLTEVEKTIADWSNKRLEVEGRISGLEKRIGELREECNRLREELTSAEIEVAQKRLSADHVKEQIKQKYQVDLEQVRGECIKIIFADEGPAKVQVVSPEEMAAHGLATDWSAVGQQIDWLRKKLEEMGPVNLVALEEFEAVQERYQFLTKQYQDLVDAKAQLVELINRINAQSRQMFLETFEQIRRNFRELFVEVFGGGKADLYLVDENDVLESGIEIEARPPGKQNQNISLLSGGEQTMTAVALLFAIYQVKPSPFCVLDELDATLDEANINRFVRLVQRFTDTTQFIIITHNKRTISLADVVYGVTMEEKGVSKVVSVTLRKPENDTNDTAFEQNQTAEQLAAQQPS